MTFFAKQEDINIILSYTQILRTSPRWISACPVHGWPWPFSFYASAPATEPCMQPTHIRQHSVVRHLEICRWNGVSITRCWRLAGDSVSLAQRVPEFGSCGECDIIHIRESRWWLITFIYLSVHSYSLNLLSWPVIIYGNNIPPRRPIDLPSICWFRAVTKLKIDFASIDPLICGERADRLKW